VVWSVGSVAEVNKVNQHEARLVLGWVIIPICNQPPRSTQPSHQSVGRRNEYLQKLGCKQAHYVMHWPHIHGLSA